MQYLIPWVLTGIAVVAAILAHSVNGNTMQPPCCASLFPIVHMLVPVWVDGSVVVQGLSFNYFLLIRRFSLPTSCVVSHP